MPSIDAGSRVIAKWLGHSNRRSWRSVKALCRSIRSSINLVATNFGFFRRFFRPLSLRQRLTLAGQCDDLSLGQSGGETHENEGAGANTHGCKLQFVRRIRLRVGPEHRGGGAVICATLSRVASEWSNAMTTTVLAESCSSSFRLVIHSRLRRSRLDIGQIKLGEVERQLVANHDGTGLIVPTGVRTVAAPHF